MPMLGLFSYCKFSLMRTRVLKAILLKGVRGEKVLKLFLEGNIWILQVAIVLILETKLKCFFKSKTLDLLFAECLQNYRWLCQSVESLWQFSKSGT